MTFRQVFSVLCIGATVALSSASASGADSADAISVYDIRFNGDGQLFLNTSDGYFWASAAEDGIACPYRSIEVRKAWLAMAQAAFLSGKRLHIVYEICESGTNGIAEMWLMH
ncbi:hypothetical protein ACFL5O_04245 [Myxococcota bacterium]